MPFRAGPTTVDTESMESFVGELAHDVVTVAVLVVLGLLAWSNYYRARRPPW
jgi:hypothetical protein